MLTHKFASSLTLSYVNMMWKYHTDAPGMSCIEEEKVT